MPDSIKWTTLCKRTNDPKLSYIEELLDEQGIQHRRNGESFHAPILEVPDQSFDQAWGLLSKKIDVDGEEVELDDIDDDHEMFGGPDDCEGDDDD